MENKKIKILWGLFTLYIILQFLPFWNYILYPVNLIVTFLHEFWHAFFAFITGWSVSSIQVNSNGSGVAYTAGGWRSFVLMWGYIGSAVFGNLLLHYWLKSDKMAENIMYWLGWLMIFCAIVFFGSIMSSILLIWIGSALIYITKKFDYDSVVLSFLGLASIFHIIADFRVGPSSDLAKFSEIFIIIPQFVWMYVWLAIVVWLFVYNLKLILKK